MKNKMITKKDIKDYIKETFLSESSVGVQIKKDEFLKKTKSVFDKTDYYAVVSHMVEDRSIKQDVLNMIARFSEISQEIDASAEKQYALEQKMGQIIEGLIDDGTLDPIIDINLKNANALYDLIYEYKYKPFSAVESSGMELFKTIYQNADKLNDKEDFLDFYYKNPLIEKSMNGYGNEVDNYFGKVYKAVSEKGREKYLSVFLRNNKYDRNVFENLHDKHIELKFFIKEKKAIVKKVIKELNNEENLELLEVYSLEKKIESLIYQLSNIDLYQINNVASLSVINHLLFNSKNDEVLLNAISLKYFDKEDFDRSNENTRISFGEKIVSQLGEIIKNNTGKIEQNFDLKSIGSKLIELEDYDGLLVLARIIAIPLITKDYNNLIRGYAVEFIEQGLDLKKLKDHPLNNMVTQRLVSFIDLEVANKESQSLKKKYKNNEDIFEVTEIKSKTLHLSVDIMNKYLLAEVKKMTIENAAINIDCNDIIRVTILDENADKFTNREITDVAIKLIEIKSNIQKKLNQPGSKGVHSLIEELELSLNSVVKEFFLLKKMELNNSNVEEARYVRKKI